MNRVSHNSPADQMVAYLSPLHHCLEGAVRSIGAAVATGAVDVRDQPSIREFARAHGLDVDPIPHRGLRSALRAGDVLVGVGEGAAITLSPSFGRVRRVVADPDGVFEDRVPARDALRNGRDLFWLALRCASDLSSITSSGPRMSPGRRLLGLARIEGHEVRAIFLYAAALGVLSLAAPIATQALVNTVAFGGVMQPLIVLTVALFIGLSLAGSLGVLQAYLAEILQRRFWVRVAEDLGNKLPGAGKRAQDELDLVELNNRFFDVVTIQKVTTELLLTGSSLALQVGIGVLLLAFYHPSLAVFSMILLAGLAVVVLLGRGGTVTAQKESKAKFAMGAWLDELARNPDLFYAGPGREFCSERLAERAGAYIDARKIHYRHVLRVLLGGVGLQILAIVAVLAFGGYLVMERQLTLGQLVAAEIVVAAVAVGIGKLGRLAEKTFDSLAALDKLGYLFDLEPRSTGHQRLDGDGPMGLKADGLRLQRGERLLQSTGVVNLELAPGARLLVRGSSGSGTTTFLETLAGHRKPHSGDVQWDGIERPHPDDLAYQCLLISDRQIVAGTILDNLRVARPDLTTAEAWAALKEVGLSLLQARGGLDLEVRGEGRPLTAEERKRLVLARALVARPRLLLIDGALDLEPASDREPILELFLGRNAPWTAIVATSNLDRAYGSDLLELGAESQ